MALCARFNYDVAIVEEYLKKSRKLRGVKIMYSLGRIKKLDLNRALQLLGMTVALGSQTLAAQETALEEIVVTARGVCLLYTSPSPRDS